MVAGSQLFEELAIPELSLVVLVGTSGSGKSQFARAHFGPTEVLSSDHFRALIADDASDQSVSAAAFETLHHVADKRLEFGRLTVIDATHVERDSRREAVALARRHHAVPVAIVLDLDLETCLSRVEARTERVVRPSVVRQQRAELDRARGGLEGEGFAAVHVLRGARAIDEARVRRARMRSDRRELEGPFDLIGDVHGCADEMEALLEKLGYQREGSAPYVHPEGRTCVFLGDLVDRGPDVARALRVAIAMVEAGSAICVLGNHEVKLRRWLEGRNVKASHGLDQSIASLTDAGPDARAQAVAFIAQLQPHYVLDGGALVVCHAGLPERMHNRSSGKVRQHAVYGDVSGESDDLGLPVRLDWAKGYRGDAAVVYGHTPIPRARWRYNTLCLDTGCVFGGALTALRWPERELVDVRPPKVYYAPLRALAPEARSNEVSAAALDSSRSIETRLSVEAVHIAPRLARAGLASLAQAAHLEALAFLPPSAPTVPTLDEALAIYESEEVTSVVAFEAFGVEAAVVLCRDEAAAARFGLSGRALVLDGFGRSRLGDARLEALAAEAESSGVFERFASPWLIAEALVEPAGPASDPRVIEIQAEESLRALRERAPSVPPLPPVERLMVHRVVGAQGRWMPSAHRGLSAQRLAALSGTAAVETPEPFTIELDEAPTETPFAPDAPLLVAPRLWRKGGTPALRVGAAPAPPVGKPERARRLARRQHSLAFEALARFVEEAPLQDIVLCIHGLLALRNA